MWAGKGPDNPILREDRLCDSGHFSGLGTNRTILEDGTEVRPFTIMPDVIVRKPHPKSQHNSRKSLKLRVRRGCVQDGNSSMNQRGLGRSDTKEGRMCGSGAVSRACDSSS